MKNHDIGSLLRHLLDVFVMIFGVWTMICCVVGALGLSFQFLLVLSCLPLGLFVWFASRLRNQREQSTGMVFQNCYTRRSLVVGICSAFVTVAAYLLSHSYLVFWILAILLLGFIGRRPQGGATGLPSGTPSDSNIGTKVPEYTGLILALCLFAVTFTLISHRPDADDSFYFSMVVGTLDHPEQPILRYDDMYGESDLLLLGNAYRLKSQELLVAILSKVTSVHPKVFYYLLFPSFFAVLVVVSHWLTLREIGGSYAWLGAGVAVLIFILWGDAHRTFGNFGFVRLFQGKAVLVAIFVPATIFYTSRFVLNPTGLNWLFLTAVQVGAVGMSPSAITVVPLTSAAYLLAMAPDSKGWKTIVQALIPGLVLVMIGAIVYMGMPMEQTVPITPGHVWELVACYDKGLDTVMGHRLRKSVALLVLLLVPLFGPGGSHRRVLQRFSLALVIVILNPLLPGIVGIISERLSWRIFWAVPFPLLIGLLAQRCAAHGKEKGLPVITGALCICALFVLTPKTWTTAVNNGNRIGVPSLKVSSMHSVAQSIVVQTSIDDLVLAPYSVAAWIPTFSNHPRLVAVRRNYWHMLAKNRWKELQVRKSLMRLVASARVPKKEIQTVVDSLMVLGVSVIVVSDELPHYKDLAHALRQQNFRCTDLKDLKGGSQFKIWRVARG